jgi:hypothetical protein
MVGDMEDARSKRAVDKLKVKNGSGNRSRWLWSDGSAPKRWPKGRVIKVVFSGAQLEDRAFDGSDGLDLSQECDDGERLFQV